MSELNLQVRESLISEMEESHLTRAEVARRMKVHRVCVTQMLQGRNFTLETLSRFAEALGCRVEIKFVKEG
jgi:plasmid maintenance system antidote protein VapI